MRLLLSGYQVPAGALMRQYAESIAMALLISVPGPVPDLDRLDEYKVHKALDRVGGKKASAKLGIDREKWEQFRQTSKSYNNLSHPSVVALAAGSMIFETGSLLIGGVFDGEKADAYRAEINRQIGAAEWLMDTERHLVRLWSKSSLAGETPSKLAPDIQAERDVSRREEEV
jgi:hypothetical protein